MNRDFILFFFAIICAISRKAFASSVENCGILKIDEQIPWDVSIFTKIDGKFVHHGIGVLVSNSHVLALASSISTIIKNNIVPIEPNSIKLAVGKNQHNISGTEADLSGSEVAKIVIHDKSNSTFDTASGFDIAIIHLKRSLEFTEEILPICLRNSSGFGSGYTAHSFNDVEISENATSAKTILVNENCTLMVENLRKESNQTYFCVDNNSTKFDEIYNEKDNVTGKWYLAGILNSPTNQGSFDTTSPMFYESVGKYFDWITNEIKVEISDSGSKNQEKINEASKTPNSAMTTSFNFVNVSIVIFCIVKNYLL